MNTPAVPRMSAAGTVPVRVQCPAVAHNGCSGTIELAPATGLVAARRRPTRVRRHFRLAAGKKASVAMRLDRRTVRRLKRRRSMKMTLRVVVNTPAGQAVKLTTITVRERRTPNRRWPKRRRR